MQLCMHAHIVVNILLGIPNSVVVPRELDKGSRLTIKTVLREQFHLNVFIWLILNPVYLVATKTV